jgi:hypothetical protein
MTTNNKPQNNSIVHVIDGREVVFLHEVLQKYNKSFDKQVLLSKSNK